MEEKLYHNYYGALNNIKRSGGWMKFLAILTFIVAFFILLAALITIFGGSFFDKIIATSQALSVFSYAAILLGGVLLVFAAVLGLFAYWIYAAGNSATEINPMQVERPLANYASHLKKYMLASFIIGLFGLLGSTIALISMILKN